MNTFTASNGYKVTPNGDGANVYRGIMSTPIYPDEVQALREFFQAEGDERAGRWRWVERPDYVVYDTGDHAEVVVLDESTGYMENVWRGKERPGIYIHDAARAYFAAHPEPKPWHDAKPGEVWSIIGPSIDRYAPKGADGGAIALCFEDNSGRNAEPTLYFVFGDGGASDNVEIDDKVITAGYRIYPPQEQKA